MKKIIRIGCVILILISILLFIWLIRKRKFSEDTTETFASVPDKLDLLRNQLKQLLAKSVNYDVSTLFNNGVSSVNLDPLNITECVKKAMQKNKIPLATFTMEGNKMSEPIIKMYYETPDVFKILGNCKFLELIGRIVAIAAWATKDKSNNSSKEHFTYFVNCLDSIDWTDIKVWETMSDSKGIVMSCVKKS